MISNPTRRRFLAATASGLPLLMPGSSFAAEVGKSPFRIAVINDEI